MICDDDGQTDPGRFVMMTDRQTLEDTNQGQTPVATEAVE
jgi:hypothetical protein